MGSEGLQLPDPAQEAAIGHVVELITLLDRHTVAAWPGARTPPAAVLVGLCAWCATDIESGDGREWRHSREIPPSPCVHTPEPTRTRHPRIRVDRKEGP